MIAPASTGSPDRPGQLVAHRRAPRTSSRSMPSESSYPPARNVATARAAARRAATCARPGGGGEAVAVAGIVQRAGPVLLERGHPRSRAAVGPELLQELGGGGWRGGCGYFLGLCAHQVLQAGRRSPRSAAPVGRVMVGPFSWPVEPTYWPQARLSFVCPRASSRHPAHGATPPGPYRTRPGTIPTAHGSRARDLLGDPGRARTGTARRVSSACSCSE